MAIDKLERAILLAAADISDAMSDGSPGMRSKAMRDFMVSAIWSAASVSETLSASSWVNPNKDDGWIKSADGERFNIPDDISAEQFRDLAELLNLGKESMEKSIPARIKMQPELDGKIKEILGIGDETLDIRPEGPASANPEMAPPAEAPKLKPEDVENIIVPPKREQNIKRDNVSVPADEFEDSIEDKPGLPGDPRTK